MMSQKSNSITQQNHPVSLTKSILPGAGIALILISLFLFGVKAPDPEWGKLWMIKPLIIVPLAGAMGGAFYYLMSQLNYRGITNKALTIILSLVVYIIGLWLGTVLGLNGTLWN